MNSNESKDKPQWPDDAPPWAQWRAVDSSGAQWLYAEQPFVDEVEWRVKGGLVLLFKSASGGGSDWRSSLIQRPREKDMGSIQDAVGLWDDRPQEKPEPKQARELWLTPRMTVWLKDPSPDIRDATHFREVLPGRRTFEEWPGRTDIGGKTIVQIQKEAWDACAANNADPMGDAAIAMANDLHNEREELRKQLDAVIQERDQLTRERDEAKAIAAGLQRVNTAIEKERDEARMELEMFHRLDKSTLHCGHNEKYAFSDDGGKTGVCLRCERDKLRAELNEERELSNVLHGQREDALAELSALKSQKGGSTIESMGGVEIRRHAQEHGSPSGCESQPRQVDVKAVDSGSSAPPHASSSQLEGKEGDATCSPQSTNVSAEFGTSNPSPAVQPSGEGVPTREELGRVAFEKFNGGKWDGFSESWKNKWQDAAQAVRDRIAAVGELSFEEWLPKFANNFGKGLTQFEAHVAEVAFNAARVTREPKGLYDKTCIHHNDAEREDITCPVCLAKERDTLRQQLEAVLDSTQENEKLTRQLSDAQAEVKRLEERRVHVEASTNEICKQKDDLASTVERLRVALTTLGKNVKMLQHHSGLASGMEGQGRTQEARAQWKCFDQLVDDSLLLASITAPASVPKKA